MPSITLSVPALVASLLTIVLLCVMLRPYRRSGDYDCGAIFRLFWLIPILCLWVLHLLLTRPEATNSQPTQPHAETKEIP